MTFAQLKRYWHIELLGGLDKRFTWRRLCEKYRQRSRYRYLFWFRFAQYLHSSRFKFLRKRAERLGDRIAERFGIEIALGAQIGEGLFIPHPVGIVITRRKARMLMRLEEDGMLLETLDAHPATR